MKEFLSWVFQALCELAARLYPDSGERWFITTVLRPGSWSSFPFYIFLTCRGWMNFGLNKWTKFYSFPSQHYCSARETRASIRYLAMSSTTRRSRLDRLLVWASFRVVLTLKSSIVFWPGCCLSWHHSKWEICFIGSYMSNIASRSSCILLHIVA